MTKSRAKQNYFLPYKIATEGGANVKACIYGAIILIIITIIGSILGTTGPSIADIIAPVIATIITCALFFLFLTHEQKETES